MTNGSKPPLSADTALALLGATDDEAMREEILTRINKDDIVPILDRIADQTIHKRLVKRMLEA